LVTTSREISLQSSNYLDSLIVIRTTGILLLYYGKSEYGL
jgi:hypothetical protein